MEDLEELEELKELPLNVCGVIVYTIPEGGPVLLYMYNKLKSNSLLKTLHSAHCTLYRVLCTV